MRLRLLGNVVVIGPLVGLVGCQSYETGVQGICDAPRNCGPACDDADASARSQAVAKYIESILRNDRAKDLFSSLATMEPTARIEALRTAAKEAQLSSCTLAEEWAVSANDAPVVTPPGE